MTNNRAMAHAWASIVSDQELASTLGAFDRRVWQGDSLTSQEWEINQAAKAEDNRRRASAEER